MLNEISQGAVSSAVQAWAGGDLRWYAVQTRPRHEKNVTIQLKGKGIPTFLPIVFQVHRWSDRYQRVQLPLFRGYTFVRVALNNATRLSVLHTCGVVGFVGIHGDGIPIPDKQIDDIQTLLVSSARWTYCPFLNIGQRVRICGGCLDGLEGILVQRNSDQSLVVSIEMLQRSLAVRIKGYDLEPV